MFELEWRLTLLTLVVLPALHLARAPHRSAHAEAHAEGMQLNAEMNNLTVERFNVAGALLAKLFGKTDEERDRFADARRRRA